MKNFLYSFFIHKDLYAIAFGAGSCLTAIIKFFLDNTTKEVFGVSVSLWGIALIINLIDVRTGIKADTVRRLKRGRKFVFESKKGWRALEKIFVFTVIIAAVNNFEEETIRHEYSSVIVSVFTTIKLVLFFYVILLEIQSIGENEKERFGKKSKVFILLDDIIEIINTGIRDKIKDYFKK